MKDFIIWLFLHWVIFAVSEKTPLYHLPFNAASSLKSTLMLQVFYPYPQGDAGVCSKRTLYRCWVVERHWSGPGWRFHLHLPTLAICLTPMSIRFAATQSVWKFLLNHSRGVEFRGKRWHTSSLRAAQPLIWKANLVEMRWAMQSRNACTEGIQLPEILTTHRGDPPRWPWESQLLLYHRLSDLGSCQPSGRSCTDSLCTPISGNADIPSHWMVIP